MKEIYDPIPEHCKSCPVIAPTHQEYTQLEAELYFAKRSQTQLSEYADPHNVSALIADLEQEVSRLRGDLERLRLRTLGCVGVKLSQVILGEERIDQLDCQSLS